MAPERRKGTEVQHLSGFGVVGRRTGLTLPDNGVRDEDGFEPTDDIFRSSPHKASASKSARKSNGNGNSTLYSDDMEEGESSIPEPKAVLESRKKGSMVLPPPRGKSPAKTNLNSPARRNPSLAPVSSPVRGTIVEPRSASVAPSVVRKLNFSTGNLDQSPIAPSPHKNGLSSTKIGTGKLGKAPVIAPLKRPFQNVPNDEDENEDDTPDQVEIEEAADGSNFEESYQLNGLDDDIPDEEDGVEALEAPIQEEESELAPISVKPVKSVRGRPKQIVHEAPADEGDETVPGSVPVAKKARGRPKRANAAIEEEHDSDKRQTKRPRRSDASEVVQHAKSKPQRVAPVATKPKPKAGSKKSRLSIVAESDSPQVQRGPPMPRRKDLVIVRRETPMEGGQAFKQTRSGRASMRPLAYWLGEKAEYSDDDDVENDKPRFLSRSIKEVIRVEEVPVSKPKKWKNKSSKKQTIVESEDEDLAEPWEAEPGRLYGHVVSWDPEDPAGSHGDEREDEIALSSAAINTRDVADASFKFAKTLTLPFFGSGVVDLPPGAIKRQKNARKMQMAFFVFTGRVKAIVNGNEFRISKGGMFQVPRGNSYSIENDYETEARIFFSQGCEVIQEDPNDSQG